jgi:accessory Sec system glycosyltransferase GtfB
MEECSRSWVRGQGVLLLDGYGEMAQMLKDSFRLAGFEGPVIVLSEEAFLPADVMSIWRLAAEGLEPDGLPGTVRRAALPDKSEQTAYSLAHAGWKAGQSRYFDQIEAPDWWEISADGSSGKIHDMNHLRGRIYYAPIGRSRIAADVDWLDESGTPRFTDHYDRDGALFARTTFNGKGQRFCCTWFDSLGRERVVSNYVTGDIILAGGGKTQHFADRTGLAVAILSRLGLAGERIFYNSLSWPLFVSERLGRKERDNVLFWQERPRPDVPGNMQMILEGRSHTSKIYVQDAKSAQKLLELGAEPSYISTLGFAYDFCRTNASSDNVLICTNSDQIEGLDELLDALPDMRFHICAVTEMSSKLMAEGARPNVHLHPVCSTAEFDSLFASCDWYLDINRGSEIVDALRRAFLADQLILGFADTLHRPRFVDPGHVFADAESMAGKIADIRRSSGAMSRHVARQHAAAMAESPESFRKLIFGRA